MTAHEVSQKKKSATTKVCPTSHFENPMSQNQGFPRRGRAKIGGNSGELRMSG